MKSLLCLFVVPLLYIFVLFCFVSPMWSFDKACVIWIERREVGRVIKRVGDKSVLFCFAFAGALVVTPLIGLGA